MGALEPPHLIIILVIVVIIFGPGKLPQLGKALGDGLRELKHATEDDSPAKQRADAQVAPDQPFGAATAYPCPRCQAPIPAADRFCGTCGAQRSAPDVAVTTHTGAR